MRKLLETTGVLFGSFSSQSTKTEQKAEEDGVRQQKVPEKVPD